MMPTNPTHGLHIAVLDTETTGLSPQTDRIIEVAVKLLRVDAEARLLAEVDVYESLHDPGIRIPADATAVHGITTAMVKGHRIDGARLAGILGQADLVVAHNSGFDKGFVCQVMPQADSLLWGCSCRGIPWKRIYPHLWSISLPNLARALRIRSGTAHRALGDVETTVALLLQPDPTGTTHLGHLVAKKLPKRRREVVPPSPALATPSVDLEAPAQFILRVLGEFRDNECSLADLYGWQPEGQRHSRAVLGTAARELRSAGLVLCHEDLDRTEYWSLA